jgi:very-short-patch-repair endonuclease
MDELQSLCEYQIDINFRASGHILDGYIHELNLGIEFDEEYHQHPHQIEKDRQREENILKEVPQIRFFRVSEKDWIKEPQTVIKRFIETVYPQEDPS